MKALGWLPIWGLPKVSLDADVNTWVQVVQPCIDLHFIK